MTTHLLTDAIQLETTGRTTAALHMLKAIAHQSKSAGQLKTVGDCVNAAHGIFNRLSRSLPFREDQLLSAADIVLGYSEPYSQEPWQQVAQHLNTKAYGFAQLGLFDTAIAMASTVAANCPPGPQQEDIGEWIADSLKSFSHDATKSGHYKLSVKADQARFPVSGAFAKPYVLANMLCTAESAARGIYTPNYKSNVFLGIQIASIALHIRNNAGIPAIPNGSMSLHQLGKAAAGQGSFAKAHKIWNIAANLPGSSDATYQHIREALTSLDDRRQTCQVKPTPA